MPKRIAWTLMASLCLHGLLLLPHLEPISLGHEASPSVFVQLIVPQPELTELEIKTPLANDLEHRKERPLQKNESEKIHNSLPTPQLNEAPSHKMSIANPDNSKRAHPISIANVQSGILESRLLELHQAISQHQQYPALARRRQQRGRTGIEFLLLPNGQVQNIKVTHPSPYPLLDQAAIRSVKRIAPFIFNQHPLNVPHHFVVSVVFSV